MMIPEFAIPAEQRRQLTSIRWDRQKLGSEWIRCRIVYHKGFLLLCLVVLGVFGLSLALCFNHESLAWLYAITIASFVAVVYLLVLFIWRISGRQNEFIILRQRLYQIKNGMVRQMLLSELIGIKANTSADQITIFGTLEFNRCTLKFRYHSRDQSKLFQFLNILSSNEERSPNPEHLMGPQDDTESVSFWNGVTRWALPVVIILGLGSLVSSSYTGIIDGQNYRLSVGQNTATSYRQYLADALDIRFRENATEEIRSLYDQYIAQMPPTTTMSQSPQALKDLLVYVRDSSQYEVPVVFESSSELTDSGPQNLKLQSAKPAFDTSHREALEVNAIESIRNAFSGIFPSDILTIENREPSPSQAFFRIAYVYKDDDDSVYYNTKEKSRPLEERELYYGIKIHWDINLTIPGKGMITIAKTDSVPAPEFDIASNSEQIDVYSRMAETAFADLTSKLKKLLL